MTYLGKIKKFVFFGSVLFGAFGSATARSSLISVPSDCNFEKNQDCMITSQKMDSSVRLSGSLGETKVQLAALSVLRNYRSQNSESGILFVTGTVHIENKDAEIFPIKTEYGEIRLMGPYDVWLTRDDSNLTVAVLKGKADLTSYSKTITEWLGPGEKVSWPRYGRIEALTVRGFTEFFVRLSGTKEFKESKALTKSFQETALKNLSERNQRRVASVQEELIAKEKAIQRKQQQKQSQRKKEREEFRKKFLKLDP